MVLVRLPHRYALSNHLHPTKDKLMVESIRREQRREEVVVVGRPEEERWESERRERYESRGGRRSRADVGSGWRGGMG